MTILSLASNETLTINVSKDLLNPKRVFFQIFYFLVFFYMIPILFTSNLITDTVRGYRRSLPYLRINIILILNCSLVEVYNAYFKFRLSIL